MQLGENTIQGGHYKEFFIKNAFYLFLGLNFLQFHLAF
jgi:hypothetical protein